MRGFFFVVFFCFLLSFLLQKNVSFGRSSFSNSNGENNGNIDDNNTHNRESRNTRETRMSRLNMQSISQDVVERNGKNKNDGKELAGGGGAGADDRHVEGFPSVFNNTAYERSETFVGRFGGG